MPQQEQEQEQMVVWAWCLPAAAISLPGFIELSLRLDYNHHESERSCGGVGLWMGTEPSTHLYWVYYPYIHTGILMYTPSC